MTSSRASSGLIGAHDPAGSDGMATPEVEADERHLNSEGTVHGGLLATFALLES